MRRGLVGGLAAVLGPVIRLVEEDVDVGQGGDGVVVRLRRQLLGALVPGERRQGVAAVADAGESLAVSLPEFLAPLVAQDDGGLGGSCWGGGGGEGRGRVRRVVSLWNYIKRQVVETVV